MSGIVKEFKTKLTDAQKLKYCRRCYYDFYNGHNDLKVKKCWHLESARLVIRDNIYWSIHQVKPSKVKTLSCFQEDRH